MCETKPRHVTPQINCLGKTSTVLRVSTHIFGVSQEIDGKMFIFESKPRHVTPQINHLGKTSTVLRVSTRSSWKNEHCSKPRRVETMEIYGVSKEIDGKMFIFRGSLGM